MFTLRQIRRILIALTGGTVVLVGAAMLVLPGPAFIVIPAGLAILATEFAWARRTMRQVKEYFASTNANPNITTRPRWWQGRFARRPPHAGPQHENQASRPIETGTSGGGVNTLPSPVPPSNS